MRCISFCVSVLKKRLHYAVKYNVSYSPSDCEFFSFARDSSKIVRPLFGSCQKEMTKFTIRPLSYESKPDFFFSPGTFLIFARNKTENKNTRQVRNACTREKHALKLSTCNYPFLSRSHVQHAHTF